jgi:tetratricopeptide (TPR) repeat protein
MDWKRVVGTAGLGLALAVGAPADEAARKYEWSTKSEEARKGLVELRQKIESFAGNQQAAEKIVAQDPDWCLAVYYLSAVTPPPDNQKHLDRAVALAKKGGSDFERQFIEAMVIARGDKPQDAIEPLAKVGKEYPEDRVVPMILGQLLAAQGKNDEARASYERAKALDASTPRVHAFLANLLILQGDYPGARDAFARALKLVPPGGAAGPIRYGEAFTYLYEGKVDAALQSLQSFVTEYKNAGAPFGIPEVFIWNSIARINLENGRYPEAMKAYEQGYASVPGSGLDETQKKIWLGRLEHGKARTHARMGQSDEAWKETQVVRKMIDDGGEPAKQFEPAWNYLAGYVKLAAGDAKAAVEFLKKADPNDPFHKLMLARAYEKLGDKGAARKAYEEVVASNANTLERALAYPEAKKKLQAL